MSSREALIVILSDTFPLALILLVDGYANDYRLALHDDAKRELSMRSTELGTRVQMINRFFDRLVPLVFLGPTIKTLRIEETRCKEQLSVDLRDFAEELRLYSSDAHIDQFWAFYEFQLYWRGKRIPVFPTGRRYVPRYEGLFRQRLDVDKQVE
jgi:hypothetical protein